MRLSFLTVLLPWFGDLYLSVGVAPTWLNHVGVFLAQLRCAGVVLEHICVRGVPLPCWAVELGVAIREGMLLFGGVPECLLPVGRGCPSVSLGLACR